MTRPAAAALWGAALGIAPASLPAQAGEPPTLVLTIFGGVRGGSSLWALDGQPFLVQTLAGPQPGTFDTLDLRRDLVPGFIGGVTATYFAHPYLGLQAEVSFLGMSLESGCRIRLSQPPTMGDINPQLCLSLHGQGTTTSAVNLSAGVVARLAPGGALSPYVRLHGGIIARTRSTIEMIGFYQDGASVERAFVVQDPAPNKSAPALTAAAGVAMPLGPGYQLRLELRDTYTSLDQVTGPGDPSAATLRLPHEGGYVHNVAFSAAVDILLERRRGRRY